MRVAVAKDSLRSQTRDNPATSGIACTCQLYQGQLHSNAIQADVPWCIREWWKREANNVGQTGRNPGQTVRYSRTQQGRLDPTA